MVVEWKIEIRTDFADKAGKDAAFKKAVQNAGVHLFATAMLLADGQKPRIAITGDDFFSGTEEISMFADVIAQGKEQLKDLGNLAVNEDGDEVPISQELLDAVRNR
jgi:hypothetical protein